MQKPPSLLEVQNWLRWVITDPRGVDRALSGDDDVEMLDPRRYVEPQPKLFSMIGETVTATRHERLSVYAEGYFLRLLEVMEADFPATRRALGDEFTRVCATYLEVHPSNSPNIENVGARFPDFLTEFQDASTLPYLPELASLEWGKVEAFYAPGLEKINLNSLRGVTEAAWTHAAFDLNPSVRLFECSFPVDTLCGIEDDGNFEMAKSALQAEPTFILVQKQNDWPVVKRLERTQYFVVSSIRQGMTLGDILSGLNESSSADVMGWFSQWVQSGLLSAIRFPDGIN